MKAKQAKDLIKLVDPQLLVAEPPDPRYVGSPFEHLKVMQSKVKGSRFEMIAQDVFKKLGYTVTKHLLSDVTDKKKKTDYDFVANGERYEEKGGTLNKNTDVFSFMQIRPKQTYDRLLFVMFYPHELVMMYMEKQLLLDLIASGALGASQHGGKDGDSGTYVYYGNKETLLELGAKHIEYP